MREFTFEIQYEHGADPLMDVFLDYPELVAHSLDGCVAADWFWRVERVRGPAAALEEVERLRFDDSQCGETVTQTDCEATRYHDVLERTPNERVIYTYLENIRNCESFHTIAGRYLEPGTVFETHRVDDTHQWRILMRSDAKAGLLYDTLGSRLRDGLSFRMGHLRDAVGWQQNTLAGVSIPDEQQEALVTAVEFGYYETPREATLDEIAESLDIPRSTLSYRLRQAEAQLALRYVDIEK
ncbi:helix-turn-helix domain-containing protein [Halomarina rubra]|uniref:Helix-turn-helix domain-containing protein n=1 Tax=Halomarina rubra TaxID=2071873 RepID=A0ABD6AUF8_9EURY|nr:helix-turn-helix domain-containing protein [Halomarina rubra]